MLNTKISVFSFFCLFLFFFSVENVFVEIFTFTATSFSNVQDLKDLDLTRTPRRSISHLHRAK